VNPIDEEKQHLVGRKLITPIYGKEVEIVADNKVDPEFGTGLVMICTIGDKDDLEWVYRYNLPIENGIDGQGKMAAIAGKYKGMEISDARNAMIEDLKKDGLLSKQESLEQSVGACWRCRTPIEFIQVPQWFLKTLDAKEDVLRIADELNWYPDFMKIRLQNWVNSLNRDWVISRQRYFATPIPIWECNSCGDVILAKEEDCYLDPTVDAPPVDACPECGEQLQGCEDVFDTWMDSSISPLYISYWQRDDELFEKLFPTSLRPQGQDIIRTWAFYTILRSHYLTGQHPWNDIMVDGYILAPDGRPMHASDGNVIDPLELLDEHGSDAWRYYSSTVTVGVDSAIQLKDIVHGQRFCTKLWNVEKFLSTKIHGQMSMETSALRTSDKWILTKYSRMVEEVTEHYDNFEFDKVIRKIENFTWHQLADHYIEMVKHRDDDALAFTLYEIGLGLIKLLAPLTPHICDEIYENLYKKHDGAQSVTVSEWPEPIFTDPDEEEKGELLKDIIGAVRNWKSEKGLALSTELELVEIIGPKIEYLLGCEEDIVGTLKAKDVLLMGEADVVETPVEIKPNHALIGPRFREHAKEIGEKLSAFDPVELAPALETGELSIQLSNGETVKIEKSMVEIRKEPTLDGKKVQSVPVGDLLILIGE
jgi:valyl-tRNA synthetase